MRFSKTNNQKERLFSWLLEIIDRLFGKISASHIGIDGTHWPAVTVEPNTGWIFEWFPRGLDFHARRQRLFSFSFEPLTMFVGIDSQIEAIFIFAIEVHLTDSCSLVTIGLQNF